MDWDGSRQCVRTRPSRVGSSRPARLAAGRRRPADRQPTREPAGTAGHHGPEDRRHARVRCPGSRADRRPQRTGGRLVPVASSLEPSGGEVRAHPGRRASSGSPAGHPVAPDTQPGPPKRAAHTLDEMTREMTGACFAGRHPGRAESPPRWSSAGLAGQLLGTGCRPKRGRAVASVANPAGDSAHVHAAGDELSRCRVAQVMSCSLVRRPSRLVGREKRCVAESGCLGCRSAGSKGNT